MSVLLNDLYSIEQFETTSDTTANAVVSVNAAHAIFKGHFPEHPVMPGVCQLQMLTDVAIQFLGRKLELQAASNMKFLAMLDPNTFQTVDVEVTIKKIEGDLVSIWGKVTQEEHTFLKFRGTFKQ